MTAEDIQRMMQGAQVAAILRAGLELGVFDALTAGPKDAAAVAKAIGADPRGARILLDALCALGLLAGDAAGYRLTEAAAAHLISDRPGFVGGMARIGLADHSWEAFRRLPEAVRRGGAVLAHGAETHEHPFWESFAQGSVAMATAGGEALATVLAPWASQRKRLEVLDVACGTGLYGFTLARHQPHARVTSLDWPNVLPHTRPNAERLGVLDRVRFLPGDAFTTPLAGPYDLVILSQILHHFPEERSLELLHRVAAALAPDGRVAIHEFLRGEAPPAQEPFPYLFAVTMLTWTQRGDAYTRQDLARLLERAGFGAPEVHAPPRIASRLVLAQKLA